MKNKMLGFVGHGKKSNGIEIEKANNPISQLLINYAMELEKEVIKDPGKAQELAIKLSAVEEILNRFYKYGILEVVKQ